MIKNYGVRGLKTSKCYCIGQNPILELIGIPKNNNLKLSLHGEIKEGKNLLESFCEHTHTSVDSLKKLFYLLLVLI